MDILVIWMIGGPVMAGLWLLMWPIRKHVPKYSRLHIILRWSHALVWFLLAAVVFVGNYPFGQDQPGLSQGEKCSI
jgi:hypothetical protein